MRNPSKAPRWRIAGRLALTALLIFSARTASAQRVSIDLLFGSAYNVPMPLTVRQDGYPDIHFTGRYDTKPFGPLAPYYAARLSFWKNDRAWEVQFVHHRLFLSNTTPEVERFEVHFGYSYLLFGRAWKTHGFDLHASGGILITNPANRIRGRSLPSVGYNVSGGGGAFTVTRDFKLADHFSVLGEGAVMAGSTSVPVVDGSARVHNVSLHGRFGVRVWF
jgi:hypothetical protein